LHQNFDPFSDILIRFIRGEPSWRVAAQNIIVDV
jgi:hypothetical protein